MGRPGPLSLPVLVGAALVSSPALWRALDGAGAPGVALTRFLVCLVLCWAALSGVSLLVGPPPRQREQAAGASADAVPDEAAPDAAAPDAAAPDATPDGHPAG